MLTGRALNGSLGAAESSRTKATRAASRGSSSTPSDRGKLHVEPRTRHSVLQRTLSLDWRPKHHSITGSGRCRTLIWTHPAWRVPERERWLRAPYSFPACGSPHYPRKMRGLRKAAHGHERNCFSLPGWFLLVAPNMSSLTRETSVSGLCVRGPILPSSGLRLRVHGDTCDVCDLRRFFCVSLRLGTGWETP
jgi:hypothetical protein